VIGAGRPILTAAAMRAAEEAAMARGTSVETLMERAGAAIAEAVWRFAASPPTLILCGPGNNGGDGYVTARILRERGLAVRIAAAGEPRTPAAQAARAMWNGPVEPIEGAQPAVLLIDCLFGTGLSRGLDPALSGALMRLADAARLRVAADLPSGVATDEGTILSPVPRFDLTVALGALKPAHRLQPAAFRCGRVVVAHIGLGTLESALHELARPSLPAPGPDDNKYTRGKVAVVAGRMTGAAMLAAQAAQRAGAGYVELWKAAVPPGAPWAIVRRGGSDLADLGDRRIGALVIGPGLGRDEVAGERLEAALASGRPLVLDADALTLIGESGLGRLADLPHLAILTPHEGEFTHMFGTDGGSKIERARIAAARSGAVVVLKGADSVVAHPDGRAIVTPPAPAWLASAGTGDVLAGVTGAMRARGLDAFEAASAALWLHAAAAEQAGPGLIADDLPLHLPTALAACL
jgi:hydroxyethylthiazole kinase-like uncharacterized protein yjeF